MPKFIITWDAGFGEQLEVVEADDLAEAEQMAQEALDEDLSSKYGCAAVPYSKDAAKSYNLVEDESDEEETDQ